MFMLIHNFTWVVFFSTLYRFCCRCHDFVNVLGFVPCNDFYDWDHFSKCLWIFWPKLFHFKWKWYIMHCSWLVFTWCVHRGGYGDGNRYTSQRREENKKKTCRNNSNDEFDIVSLIIFHCGPVRSVNFIYWLYWYFTHFTWSNEMIIYHQTENNSCILFLYLILSLFVCRNGWTRAQ